MDKILAQDEIDALLKTEQTTPAGNAGADPAPPLTDAEKDALGEVGNICMGSAATTLSTLLGHKVSITSPKVELKRRENLLKHFTAPFLLIEVSFTDGLSGSVMLVIRLEDAAVIADMMMGNDGTAPPEELGDMEISAAAEAMNQMIGSAATALASLVGRTVSISPPNARVVGVSASTPEAVDSFEETMVVVAFHMRVGELVDTELLQIMSVETARAEAALLWRGLEPEAAALKDDDRAPTGQPQPEPPDTWSKPVASAPASEAPRRIPEGPAEPPLGLPYEKLDLILDLPLKVTVILGRTKRPIKEVLGLAPGSILELATLADEPVEVLVNGALVAWGEVVVVNDNFGVRITSIISPRERIQNLRPGMGGYLLMT